MPQVGRAGVIAAHVKRKRREEKKRQRNVVQAEFVGVGGLADSLGGPDPVEGLPMAPRPKKKKVMSGCVIL